ncbi:30S ribosomal protein S4 [Candidatus Pacearchaeota archaeon]|nr:30S ribosomal protein S4 [Candidatus Pacearchaeota archaeon]|tara:strand:- start:4391 stop:5011 length:621 start_codon:yes stop_codon:yes gene_type:complete
MIKKKKSYSRPKKPFEATRISEENSLVLQFGLKNKREVWKNLAKVNYFRKRAMALANATEEDQEVFFNKLKAIGLKADSLSDVLDLQPIDLLQRRLPTLVASKNLASTVKQARQLVVHKKILIDNKVVNSPGYIVSTAEEPLITLKQKKKTAPAPAPEEKSKTPEPPTKEKEEPTADLPNNNQGGGGGPETETPAKPEAQDKGDKK